MEFYPLPKEPMVITITPDMAGEWLDQRNEGNRNFSARKVELYAREMLEGRWTLTHQGVAFDTFGKVIDGQHRLKAVVVSQLPQQMWVFPDMPRDTFDVVDTGYIRQAGQFLNTAHSNICASALRYISAATDPSYPRCYRSQMSVAESLSLYRQWPEVERYSAAAQGVRAAVPIPASPLLAVVAMGERGGVTWERMSGFLEPLRIGLGFDDERDPRLMLRNRFIRSAKELQGRRTHAYVLIAKAYNAWVTGNTLGKLLYSEGDNIPVIAGMDRHQERRKAA
jgi:hypothetical protein